MFRILRFSILVLVALVAALGIAALFLLEPTPLVAETEPPSPEDVETARALVKTIRAATEDPGDGAGADPVVRISLAEANAALRLGARVLPGFRGEAEARSGLVTGAASVPVDLPWGQRWLNVAATAPPFEGEPRLSRLRVGGVPLPPGPAVALGRLGANLVLGDQAGDRILSAAAAMDLDEDVMVFTMALNEDSRGRVMRSVFGALRGGEMPEGDHIDRHFVAIRDAIEAGTLPDRGSLLPHLKFALDAALAEMEAGTDPGLAYTAAIFGLTKACGAWNFSVVVGGLAGEKIDDLGTWTRDCSAVTLAERRDSRLHFVTSAALQAASNRGFSVSVGEFKELRDSIRGGTGFDFTDLAANLSGIRLSDVMMGAGPPAWPDRLARIEDEADVLVAFKGLPGRMTEAEFAAIFGDLESPAYQAMVAGIEARIDTVTLYKADP